MEVREESKTLAEQKAVMKEAIRLGIWIDLQYFIEEAKRERRRPYVISKGAMADLLYRYLRTVYRETERVTYNEEQWIVITPAQKRALVETLEKRMEKHIRQTIDLQRTLQEARGILGGTDADRKGSREKTA